ncbi:multi-sensor signal transduction histidine kinase [Clostridium sartagoforme AAU1]|jgi:two-component system, sensor histidine kinase YesM|uniref:histidine kinase n=1 Tax=Clostridium sartagoforme AAU1 TaxID=1202534 RepID=R9CED5_9CLOT|nr:sensor histidine kinase [Clostridium sartagoforme]EOR27667.1 multi-sensor signal transduction histidine kinase [Clostridium sartagoforme AAU1]
MLGSIKKKIIGYYRKASFKYIISISFTIVAVIGMIVVGGALYLRFINSTEEMVSKNNKSILEQVNLNLDAYLRKMMKISDTIYYRAIKKTDLSTESIDKEMDLIYEANKDYLISISLFSNYGEVIASYPLQQLKNNIDPRENEWFKSAINRRENLHFSTPHVQNLFYDPNYKYTWVVSLSRAVELTESGKINGGVLLVDMNFSGIEQICKNVDMGKNAYVYLIDRDGEIIYHPRQQLIYSNLIKENNYEAAKYEDGNYIENFQGNKRSVTVKTVGYTGWKIVAISPMANITEDYYQIRIFAIFIMLFGIFILISLNMFVSSRIANPIKELEKSVNEFENGVVSLNISEKGSYEIQHLGKAIKSMVKQMNILMKNVMNEQEEKRKSELNALQAQINPHFLYNTLDSIIWMIENENYDGAIIMVTALARFFRISLSKGKNVITVRDELEHARNYLTIQNIRYKNKFTYDIKAEENTLNLASIKLIIQPLIENAIYHGMEYMSGDGDIMVQAYIKNNDLYIDIIDNGLGMPQEVADKLLIGESNIQKKGSGIGLRNVHERIKLYFGENYGLEVYSEPDEGTTISVHMPCIDYYSIKEEK